jgi:CubicO group peptidase (beta-lactamase class C family)
MIQHQTCLGLSARFAWRTLSCLLMIVVANANGQQRASSEKTNDSWEIADPSAVNLDSESIKKLLDLVKSGQYKNIHSMLIVKNGKLVVEEYFPGSEEDGQERMYGPLTRHGIHSATKSINGLLFGIALEQRLIPDVEVKISSYFPDYADVFKDKAPDEIRLKHLLAMTAGLSWDEDKPYTDPRNDHVAMNASGDPVRYVLERPVVAPPGAKFNYSSGISIVLGEIIHRATGMPADKYAERHLFGPLGIADYAWLKYPNGIVQTGGGLSMRARDMAKIGQMMLDGGRWRGKQIIPEAWLRDSTRQQAPDRTYGYQWWLGTLSAADREIVTVGAQGRGGQFILILPAAKMVAVFTGWNDGNGLGEQPYDMMRRYILPADRELTQKPSGK